MTAGTGPSGRHPRQWLAPAVGLLGAVLLVLGWYGVSGHAVIGEQVPYLASGSIPGAALVVAAAVLLASDARDRRDDDVGLRVAELHALLVEDEVVATPTAGADGLDVATGAGPVAAPSGDHFHRPGCMLVVGKPDVAAVGAEAVERRGLSPCPVCVPDAPAGS